MNNKSYWINYEFQLEGGRTKGFDIEIDQETMTAVHPKKGGEPEWTRLEYKQCGCCPLSKNEHPKCPIAVNISDLVDAFKDVFSSELCTVRCTTPERTYLKKTMIQEGLFSIFGIINATSLCPIMKPLKPMARFHLPFSTLEETIIRSTSFYLLGQYFENKRNKAADFDLSKLDEHYDRIRMVDERILERITSLTEKDAGKSAFVALNSLAQLHVHGNQ